MRKKLKVRFLTLIFIGIFLFSAQPKGYPLGASAIGRNTFKPIWPKFDDLLDDTDWGGLGTSIVIGAAGGAVGYGVGQAAGVAASAAGPIGSVAYNATYIGTYAVGMGAWGGISSKIQGGNFEDGFLAGSVTGAITGGVRIGLDGTISNDWVRGVTGAGIGGFAGAGIGYLIDGEQGMIQHGISGAMTGFGAGFNAGSQNSSNPESYNPDNFAVDYNTGETWYIGDNPASPVDISSEPLLQTEKGSILEKIAFKAVSGFATTSMARTAGLAMQYEYQDKMRDTIIQARQEDWSDERLEGELDDLQDESILWTNIGQYTAAGVMTSFAGMAENAAFKQGYEAPGLGEAFANLGKGAFVGGIGGLGAGLAYTSTDYKKNPRLAQLYSEAAGMGAGILGQTLVTKIPVVIKDLFSEKGDEVVWVKTEQPRGVEAKVEGNKENGYSVLLNMSNKPPPKDVSKQIDDHAVLLKQLAKEGKINPENPRFDHADVVIAAIGKKWEIAKKSWEKPSFNSENGIAVFGDESWRLTVDGWEKRIKIPKNAIGRRTWVSLTEEQRKSIKGLPEHKKVAVAQNPGYKWWEGYRYDERAGKWQEKTVKIQNSKGITIASVSMEKFNNAGFRMERSADNYSWAGEDIEDGRVRLIGSSTFLDIAIDFGQRLSTPANISTFVGSGIKYVTGDSISRNTNWHKTVVNEISSSLGDIGSTIVNTSLLSAIASGIPLGYMNPSAKNAHLRKMKRIEADLAAQGKIADKVAEINSKSPEVQKELVNTRIKSIKNKWKTEGGQETGLKKTLNLKLKPYKAMDEKVKLSPDDIEYMAYDILREKFYNENLKKAKENYNLARNAADPKEWDELSRNEQFGYWPTDIEDKGKVFGSALWGDIRSNFITRALPAAVSAAMDFVLKNNTNLDSSSRAYLTGGVITPAVFGIVAGYNPIFDEYEKVEDLTKVDWKSLGPLEGAIAMIGGAQVSAVIRMAGFGFPGTNPSISAFNNYAGSVTSILPKPYMPLFVVSSSKDKAKAEEDRKWYKSQYVKNIYKNLGETYIANTLAVSENIAKAFNTQRTFLVKIVRPAITLEKDWVFAKTSKALEGKDYGNFDELKKSGKIKEEFNYNYKAKLGVLGINTDVSTQEVIRQLYDKLSPAQQKDFMQGDRELSIGGTTVAETTKTGYFIMHTHPDTGISKITAEYFFNIQLPKSLTGIKSPYFYKHPTEKPGQVE